MSLLTIFAGVMSEVSSMRPKPFEWPHSGYRLRQLRAAPVRTMLQLKDGTIVWEHLGIIPAWARRPQARAQGLRALIKAYSIPICASRYRNAFRVNPNNLAA